MKNLYIALVSLFLFNLSNAQLQIGSNINGESTEDFAGWSVSLSGSGSVLAVGAPFNDGGASSSGHVRVYQNNNGTWSQIGGDIDGERNDVSGWSVSLSSDGSIVAIGSPSIDIRQGSGVGTVRVYKNVNGTWSQLGEDIADQKTAGEFGVSVSLSSDGTVLAIGAPGHGVSNRGMARVYKFDNNAWGQVGSDIDGENQGDSCGTSVSLSNNGQIIAIGSPKNDGAGDWSGHVRVYQNSMGTWTKVGADIDGQNTGDESGTSVSLSGDGGIVAVGAPQSGMNGSDSGQVRVFKNIGGTWTQLGSDIDGESSQDLSGHSVSLNSDGNILAIGAPFNRVRGHMRVFEDNAGTWSQVGMDIDGEDRSSSYGWSVGISDDGRVAAMGGYSVAGNGRASGQVQVFNPYIELTVPDAPVAKKATNKVLGTGFTANWEAVDDVIAYRLDVALDENFTNMVAGYANKFVGNVTSFDVITTEEKVFYRIAAVNDIGLSRNSNVILVDMNSVGINNVKTQEISVYPNPTKGKLKLGLSVDQIISLNVIDYLGKTVYKKENVDSNHEFDISELKEGLYFLRIITGDGVVIARLIKGQ